MPFQFDGLQITACALNIAACHLTDPDSLLRGARWFIETWPYLKHREWLKTPGLLERELERLRLEEPDVYAELPTLGGGVLARKLDRVGPEGAQS